MSAEERVVRCFHEAFAGSGIAVSPARVRRLARRFTVAVAADPRLAVREFLEAESWSRVAIPLSEWARVIAYADPTGETAVANVLRG